MNRDIVLKRYEDAKGKKGLSELNVQELCGYYLAEYRGKEKQAVLKTITDDMDEWRISRVRGSAVKALFEQM